MSQKNFTIDAGLDIVNGGNISGVTNLSASGNITANNFIGNGSQLSGIVVSSGSKILNGISNVEIPVANSTVLVNADGAQWIFGTDATLTIPGDIVSNQHIGIGAVDDVTITGGNKNPGTGAEGGDINVFAGDGAHDTGSGPIAGSGGDVLITAGEGGTGNVHPGGVGGVVNIIGGPGGNNGNAGAGDGGDINITAGEAGFNNGNFAQGGFGGDVSIEAGITTLANTAGGDVHITSGVGGPGGSAGTVTINIPLNDAGPGGQWVFNGLGNVLNTPQNAEIFSINAGNILFGTTGNTIVRSVEYTYGNIYDWSFTDTGNLNLPSEGNLVGLTPNNSGYLQWVGNSSGDNNGYTTLRLVPDETVQSGDQYLIIDPTAGGHIHIRAGGAQDNSNGFLYLGGENSYFQVPAGNDPSVYIAASNNAWEFGNDGVLYTPGNISVSGNVSSTGNVTGGNIIAAGTGGDITLTGGNVVGALRVITTPTALANLTAVAGGRAFVNNANLAASGNFGAQISDGGSNLVPVWSDGTNWYIG